VVYFNVVGQVVVSLVVITSAVDCLERLFAVMMFMLNGTLNCTCPVSHSAGQWNDRAVGCQQLSFLWFDWPGEGHGVAQHHNHNKSRAYIL